MDNVIYNLSNEAYHHGKRFRKYVSSSQLKIYQRSPKAFRYALDNPQEQTDAMRFGSLFHDAISLYQQYGTIDAFYDSIVIFKAPINEKTGQPYGTTTKAYKDALFDLQMQNVGKEIATIDETKVVDDMISSILFRCGSTSEQIKKLLRWGKSEVSHFIEYEGCKFKWRPDLETKKKIVDWKTVSTDDLSEKSINNIISKYGYDISAAFYQFMEHEQSGVWKQFYWVFISKVPPFDAIMVDASEWTYKLDPDTGIVMPQVGALKMKRFLDLHIKCTRENTYPGAEINIAEDFFGMRIMRPVPPPWEVNAASLTIEQTFNKS